MRSIKFRVWDKVAKAMSDPFALFGEFTLLGAVFDWQREVGNKRETSLEGLQDLEIMQFTGLKDKNGKEIYEGDILGCETLKGMIPAWVIVYSNEYSGFRMRQVDRIKPANVQNKNAFCRYPVIGNIYENPELLTSEQTKEQ